MARIPDSEVERIKREVSLLRLIESQSHALSKHGKDWVTRCPWHAGDATPSCVITESSNLWHCFGCDAGGSVIDWTMRWHKVSFRHACELLMKESPVLTATAETLRVDPLKGGGWKGARPAADMRVSEDDQAQLDAVISFYHQTLLTAPEALMYLAKRGLDDAQLIDRFRLGFANRTLGYRLPRKDTVAGAAARGQLQRLGVLRASGHEHFTGSLVIPVCDASGRVVEVYGRKLSDDQRPGAPVHLYLPGPHRGVFNHEGIAGQDEVIVCEALIDALTFWRAGFRNVTSAFGVHGVTDELLAALCGCKRVLIAFDRDAAGDAGAAALAVRLQAAGVDVFRILFPKGMDANAYARSVQPANKSLGVAIRSAQWFGDGVAPALSTACGAGHDESILLAAETNDEASDAGGLSRIDLGGSGVAQPTNGAGAPGVVERGVERGSVDLAAAAVALGASTLPTDASAAGALVRAVLDDRGSSGVGDAGRGDTNGGGALVAGGSGAVANGVGVAPLSLPAVESVQVIDAQIRAHDVLIALGERRYRVRGLEKNLAFDVLRVNVLASNARGMHVDTFDLYQAKARALFVKQASVELGVEESVIQHDLGQVLLKLESLQDTKIREATTPKAASTPALSEAEHAAALALLRDPNLSARIVADFARIGLVGEPTNALAGYLAAVSRKLAAPLAIIVQSTSAAGKSALMDAVLKLIPEEDRVHYSAMTGQSLFYLGEKDLKHKILAIAEEEGVRQAAYALKLLQSQGELTIASTGKDPTTGMLTTQEYRVEGPVMLFLTTTAIDIDEELLNRCLVLTINESREQTRAIQQRQRQARTLDGLLAQSDAEAVTILHRNAQRLLRGLAVVNPYAERLSFLDERTRTRRDHQKYLTLIDAIALLHQHQREIKHVVHAGNAIEYIEATLEDIALANDLAHEVLGRSLDELPPQTRRLLGALDALVRERMQAHALARADVRLTRQEIRQASGLSDTRLRLHLERLVEMEYLFAHNGKQGRRFVYELAFDGPLDVDGPRLPGLIDVDTLHVAPQTSPASASTSPRVTGNFASHSPAIHPSLAPHSPVEETLRNASADAAFTLVAALAPQTAHRGTPARSRRNGVGVNGRA